MNTSIDVPWRRLACGLWRVPAGDIYRAYSASHLPRVKTFDLNGQKAPTFPTFIRNADPGSNAGIPGITVNAGMSANGLPIGIAVDGPANGDRELLGIALAMEQVLGRAPAPK